MSALFYSFALHSKSEAKFTHPLQPMLSYGDAMICVLSMMVTPRVELLSDFGHHSSPRDDIGLAFFTRLPFKSHQCPEETIQMIVYCIIQLLEGVEAFGEIGTNLRCVVVS